MARKSTRVNKRKWPCGTCGLQCNDNTVLCEGCGVWHHAKCERLSQNHLSTLKGLKIIYVRPVHMFVAVTTSQQLWTAWRSHQSLECWKVL